MDQELISALEQFREKGFITVLTGAGISAESGIPTFRGPEGYWTLWITGVSPPGNGNIQYVFTVPGRSLALVPLSKRNLSKCRTKHRAFSLG